MGMARIKGEFKKPPKRSVKTVVGSTVAAASVVVVLAVVNVVETPGVCMVDRAWILTHPVVAVVA